MKAKNITIRLEKEDNLTRKILFGIFIFTLLLYSNSIKNNYALDDNYVTVTNPQHPDNPRIEKGIKGIPEIFKTHYVESAAQSFEYRPFSLATFAIEYQFFGNNPHVSHFISVLLYALTCMLLFTILTKLFKEYNLVFPLLIIFLFIIHPIHTEVVDNIKCRDELLSFLFGLCALHFFIKSIEVENKKWKFIAFTVVFLLLGLLCKQTAILFMVLIPITAYFFYDFKVKKIFFLVIACLVTYQAYEFFRDSMIYGLPVIRDFVFFENPLYYEHSFLTRIPAALTTLGLYLKLLVFPYPLSCYYGYNTLPLTNWASPLIYVAFIFYGAIGIYAFLKLSKKNVLSYAILVFLLGILPLANLLQPIVGIVGERFIYFASFGFCIMVAYALLAFFKVDIKKDSKFKIQNTTMVFKLALTFILLIYVGLTVSRSTKWKDKLTLFTNDANNNENSYFLQNVTGITLYEELQHTSNEYKQHAIFNEAKIHFTIAAQLLSEGLIQYKTDYLTMTTLGTIYNNYLNNVDAALPYFKKSITINPKYDVTQFNIGVCYERKNLPDSAILLYEKILANHTKYPPVYFNLHELYLTKKEYNKAIVCDKQAVVECPKEYSGKAYINLGNTYMLVKDTLNAIPQFKKAVQLEPANIELRNQINAFFKKINHIKSFNMILMKVG